MDNQIDVDSAKYNKNINAQRCLANKHVLHVVIFWRHCAKPCITPTNSPTAG